MTSLADFLTRQLEQGTFPGAVALVARPGQSLDEAEVITVGRMSIDGPPTPADAIVRIQSMTKVITAVAALRLVEAGRIELDDDVTRWLPELADRRVLRSPIAELDDTVPADRPITLRHLLTNTSGYGMIMNGSPLQQAMAANTTEAGAAPPALAADPWLAALAELPLVGQPGRVWRYHHSFGVLGILVSRIAGRPLHDHLVDDLLGPLAMVDTGMYVPSDRLGRLPAAYRHDADALVETEPLGGGPYAGPPTSDVSHGELVSTAHDVARFARMLADGGRVDGQMIISAEHHAALVSDQVPDSAKTDDSFFPGFWRGEGWGYGVAVETDGDHVGRFGWSGGQGTTFFVDPDGTLGVLLTQVEMGERTWELISGFPTVAASG